MKCPCGSSKDFQNCCEPFLTRKAKPDTAEQLMRSRYSAYTRGDIEYIRDTLAPESRGEFDMKSAKHWAEQSEWRGLKIVNATENTVEFIASYGQNDQVINHHELSQFRKDPSGQWYFVDGQLVQSKQQTVKRDSPKVGRNDPCPCGSGKKFKKCCA